MKNLRSKNKLTLDHETIRYLRELAASQLVHAKGGGLEVGDTGGPCTRGQGCV
jgi:hypothetical protein